MALRAQVSAVLTPREALIAERVASGLRIRDVAAALNVSPRTVEAHLASIYRKLGLAGRAELAAFVSGLNSQRNGAEVPMPETRYARVGEIAIAYQVAGSGRHDIVVAPGIASHLEILWEQPQWRRFVSRLSSVGRVLLFDKRGTGLSDPIPGGRLQSLDERASDILAVMEAAGSEKAILFGMSEGGPMSVFFAASHPERVAGLFLYGASVIRPQEAISRRGEMASQALAAHGTGQFAARFWPSLAASEDGLAWLGRLERFALSPKMLATIVAANVEIDASSILAAVRVPVTIVHGRQDPFVPMEEGRALLQYIPQARFVPIDVVDHVPWGEVDLDTMVRELRDLADAVDWQREPAAVLLTIMAVQIHHDSEARNRVQSWLANGEGRIVDEMQEEGLLVEFDGPGVAARCAATITALAGAAVRAAVVIGEGHRRPAQLVGPVVGRAQELLAAALPGQALVSGSVRALVGPDDLQALRFESRQKDHFQVTLTTT